MEKTVHTIPVPLQITFHRSEVIADIEELIRAEAAKLERYYPRMMGCRVTVEEEGGRQIGNLWNVRIDITVPGGEIVVKSELSLGGTARQTKQASIRNGKEVRRERQILHRAVRDAFESARRQLQDYARKQRGDTKRTKGPQTAKITQVFGDKGYGFLVTPEGKEVYFHKESVLNYSFDHLIPGTTVAFTEAKGEKGPQATSVKVLHREGPHGTVHRHAA
ncbi:MAG: HPF/RaiA family ribosome-associated protein [Acidobacteriaceae bacterium]